MVLDHKNGISNDNRLENLRLICPQCNSQLETFCGRNIINKKSKHYTKRIRSTKFCNCGCVISTRSVRCKKCSIEYIKLNKKVKILKPRPRKVENRPNKEELELLIKKYPFTAIGKMYDVSDNAVRKWLKAS